MRIVDYKGELRTFSVKKDGPKVMRAIGLNLGLFGVVYDMKLRVLKTFNVHVVNSKPPMKEIFADNGKKLKKMVHTFYGVECFCFPFVWDKMWLKTFEKTTKPVNVPPSRLCIMSMENWLQLHFGKAAMSVLPKFAKLTPLFNKTGFLALPENDYVQLLGDAIHYQKHLDDLVVGDMEFCFDIKDDDFSPIVQAWYIVIDRVKEHQKKGNYPLNIALEMRFIKNSEALLSPAVGNTLSCYMEILSGIHTPGFEAFEHEIALEWMKIPGSRPHWAKYHQDIPGIAEFIRKSYGDNIQKFLEIRKELDVDPKDMFYNDWLKKIIY